MRLPALTPRFAALMMLAGAFTLTACGGGEQRREPAEPGHKIALGCVTAAEASAARSVGNEEHVAVPVGDVILDWQSESPQLKSGQPSTFPYLRPRVQPLGILVPRPLCRRQSGVNTVTIRTYFYRAIRPGDATITVAVAPGWRTLREPPTPEKSTVTVAR